jgi:hypothetical protein
MPVPRCYVTELRRGQYACHMRADLSGNRCCEQVPDVRHIVCAHLVMSAAGVNVGDCNLLRSCENSWNAIFYLFF